MQSICIHKTMVPYIAFWVDQPVRPQTQCGFKSTLFLASKPHQDWHVFKVFTWNLSTHFSSVFVTLFARFTLFKIDLLLLNQPCLCQLKICERFQFDAVSPFSTIYSTTVQKLSVSFWKRSTSESIFTRTWLQWWSQSVPCKWKA